MGHRARAFAMLGGAAVCAGLAASAVNGYTSDVRAQVGPLVPVVVARTNIAKGKLIAAAGAHSYMSERRVPSRFVPPSSLRQVSEAVGYRTLTTIRAGDYVGETNLGVAGAGQRPAAGPVTSQERLIEIPVAGAETIAPALRPGSRVDVLITTERGGVTPRTYLALQRIELADFRPPLEAVSGGEGERDATATLRVTLPQAVALTAARNFAREIRLVPRPAGDDRRLGPAAMTASELAG
jgi:Flp pilus assembly protein CpaB